MEEQWIWRNGEVLATGISRGKGGLGDTGRNRVKGGYGWNALYKRKKKQKEFGIVVQPLVQILSIQR